jgi:quercetin dioxygenase-like cupin family protein
VLIREAVSYPQRTHRKDCEAWVNGPAVYWLRKSSSTSIPEAILEEAGKEILMVNDTVATKGVSFDLKEHVTYAIGSVVSKTLLKKDTGNITLFSFDKGQGLSEHTSPYDAVVHVLDGEAEITIGGKMQTVKAGQMLIMPANVSHALLAQVQFKMLLIMIRGN